MAERRTVVVAARVARAGQTAVGPAEALRLPNVGERANVVESGLGRRRLDALIRIEEIRDRLIARCDEWQAHTTCVSR
ncbi:MAG: hypothetical protein OYK82_00825 [Gammaproteobacteria bacterium]|nr:hypothetical protein [Gammaproteobacteria bacterium]MYE94504.1 hypothetical protein [Gemmatimonadota bacterium]